VGLEPGWCNVESERVNGWSTAAARFAQN